MADDIVTRLRSENRMVLAPLHMSDAADEIERLRAAGDALRRNEWRLIWGLCTECGRSRDQEARRG